MMKNAKRFGAFAAMAAAVVFAYSAAAENTVVDWSSVSGDVSGGIYTVPADTTVNVGDADIAAVNALTKVIFADSSSVMRFTTATPATVKFQGPGAAVFAVAPVMSSTWTLGRSVEAGKESDLTRFVFERGISNATPASTRYIVLNMQYTTNTIIAIDGPLGTNINFETSGYGNWNGRFDLGENFDLKGGRKTYFGYNSNSSFAVVRQRGGTVDPSGTSSSYFSGGEGVAAYLLEGGKWIVSRDYMYETGAYAHLRQTGGEFTTSRFATSGSLSSKAIRRDIVFGGNGKASFTGRTSVFGEHLFAFTDSVDFKATYSSYYLAYNMYYATNSIWAYNGGVADFSFYSTYGTNTAKQTSSPTNSFHAFDGGVRGVAAGLAFGFSPKVKVYEKSGEIMGTGTALNTIRGELSLPIGNVLKSVRLSNEAMSKVWPAPPSVHIIDYTGYGAAAVVDYDFDTGKITNITVMCKGENYTAPRANLRYRQDERLLDTDLECTIGEEAAPEFFTFSATAEGAMMQPCAFTNHLACTAVFDMDRNGVADHGKRTTYGNAFGFRHGYGGAKDHGVYFAECTNIVLKSGELRASYLYNNYNDAKYLQGFSHEYILPKCYRIELYGGHLTGGTAEFGDIVIGGEVWLKSNTTTANVTADLRTYRGDSSTPGTLTIDAARGTNGTCTSVLKYGTVTFVSGAKIAVKNWEALPRGKRTLVLDLSETTCTTKGNATFEESDEGLLSWGTGSDAEEARLYARRNSAGMMLIFK